MNNLTKAYREDTGFHSIVNTVAIWMDVVPDDVDSVNDWMVDCEPCDPCRQRQKEEVEGITAELHKVQAENYELRKKIERLKEELR